MAQRDASAHLQQEPPLTEPDFLGPINMEAIRDMTRGDGAGHFDVHYPLMVAAEAMTLFSDWRAKQEDAVERMVADNPDVDISHDATFACYAEAICTQTFIAIVVPLLESAFKGFAARLKEHHKHGRIEIKAGSPRAGIGTTGAAFWSIEKFAGDAGQGWQSRGKVEGFAQLYDALDLDRLLADGDRLNLTALFWYRNRALHQGLHWDGDDLKELQAKIDGDWNGIFSGMTSRTMSGEGEPETKIILPMFTTEFESNLLPWLKNFLTFLGDLDLDLGRKGTGGDKS